MPWIEVLTRLLSEKVTVINEFDIETEKLKKEINERKSWTARGIDGLQNILFLFTKRSVSVYDWIVILKEVIELIYQLMNKWKTRPKTWNGREKVNSR